MTYDIVYADPPWAYYGSTTKMGAAGKHYPLMTQKDICALDVRGLMSPSAVAFVWVTCPKLHDAIHAIEAWGLHYRGVAFVWVKTTKAGVPMGARGTPPTLVKPVTELVLAATTKPKGRPFPILDFTMKQVVFAPVTRHSEKPAIVRDHIVTLCGDRPRIEMFARHDVKGWKKWVPGKFQK